MSPRRDDSNGENFGKQLRDVARVMRNHRWHTLVEISRATGWDTQSVSARVRDLRKEQFGGYEIAREYWRMTDEIQSGVFHRTFIYRMTGRIMRRRKR